MRLLAITPPASLAPRLDAELVEAWLDGGAAQLELAVLLREPAASFAQTLASPRFVELRAALAEHAIPTLISVDAEAIEQAERVLATRPALAGVQLRGDPSVAATQRWRARLGSLLIGRSCHGAEPDADAHAVDYTCVAPVFAPHTQQPGVDKRAIGLAALARWAAVVPRVFALGGVDLDTAQACLAAGASGLAGISLFFGERAAAQQNVAALRQLFERLEAGSRTPDHHVPPPRRR